MFWASVVIHAGFVKVAWTPRGNASPGRKCGCNVETISELTLLSLVIHLSKANQLAIFSGFSPCRMSFGWTTCRCAWPPPFLLSEFYTFELVIRWKLKWQQLAIFRFSPCRMSFGWTTCRCAWLHLFFHEKSRQQDMLSRCGHSSFCGWFGEVQLCT